MKLFQGSWNLCTKYNGWQLVYVWGKVKATLVEHVFCAKVRIEMRRGAVGQTSEAELECQGSVENNLHTFICLY